MRAAKAVHFKAHFEDEQAEKDEFSDVYMKRSEKTVDVFQIETDLQRKSVRNCFCRSCSIATQAVLRKTTTITIQ